MAVKALALEVPYSRTVISPKGVQPLSLFHRSVTAPLSQTPTNAGQGQKVYRRQATVPASPASVISGSAVAPLAASPAAQAPAERRPRWASMSEGPDTSEITTPSSAEVWPAQFTPPERRPRWASMSEGPDESPAFQVQTEPGRRPRWASISEEDELGLGRPKMAELNLQPTPESPAEETKPVRGMSGSQSESEDEDVEGPSGKQFVRRYSWSEYPTTPLFLEMAANKPKASGTEPRIGIDIGGVLTREGDPRYRGSYDEWDESWEADGALDSVRKIVQVFGPSNTFLVSKVRPGGKMHRRMELWLHETLNFCEETGLLKENIIFVRTVDGPQGKGVVCEKLGISHFVDDKIEVLKSIFEDEAGNSRHLVERYQGLLFHFSKGGYSQVPPSIDTSQLAPIMRRHYRPAANWTQVIEQLREKLPGQLHSRRELLTPPVIRPPEPVMMRAETRPPGPWEKVSQSTSNNPERALQWSTDGRPKLVLKPRNPALAAPIATAPSSTQQPQPKHTMKSPEIPLRPQSQLQPQVQLQSPPQAQPQPQTQVQHPARPQVPQVQQVQQASAPQADAPKPAWSQIVQGLAAAPVQQVLVSQSRQRANTAPSPTNLAPAVPMQCKQQVPVQSVGSQQRACSPPVTQTLVVGAVQQAVQNGVVSPSGRPKLQLKPRDPRLGPPGQAASANAPVEQSQPAEPPPAQPAMQPDPAGGRPRLVLKKRTEPPPAVASVNPAAVRVSSPPARPAPAQTASPGMRPAPAPAVPPPMPSQDATHGSCAKAPAALQKDPAGGRPRLVLKPRTSVK
ncbi:unnamed protein product [Durusdinium trenchii]|uniref:Uncharacterized protein n=2 Tax=Durusdinium trenchii TaxID=1381693 RepID=A0ABP0SUF3_9DINO